MSTPTTSPTVHTTGQHVIAHVAGYLLLGVLVVGALAMFVIVSVVAVRRALRRP